MFHDVKRRTQNAVVHAREGGPKIGDRRALSTPAQPNGAAKKPSAPSQNDDFSPACTRAPPGGGAA
eukprot:44037-Pyramimonas_sp.AAC.1